VSRICPCRTARMAQVERSVSGMMSGQGEWETGHREGVESGGL
jgi:hypothetical protein